MSRDLDTTLRASIAHAYLKAGQAKALDLYRHGDANGAYLALCELVGSAIWTLEEIRRVQVVEEEAERRRAALTVIEGAGHEAP